MKVLEEKLSEVKKHQSATGHPDELLRDGGRSKNLGVGLDFIGETESEDESLNEQLELNSELDARLSRLALLDQTQQEIDQISVATESMLQQSKTRSPLKPNYFKKQQKLVLTFPYLQVQNGNGVLKRLVPCLKCMELAW